LALARAYAGTSALKGDYTRTGKRTQMGMMADGVNALARFYKNNFLDRDRQLLIGPALAPPACFDRAGAHAAARCQRRALAADFLLGNITAEAMAVAAAQPPVVGGAAAPAEAVAETFEHMEADVVRLCRCAVVQAPRRPVAWAWSHRRPRTAPRLACPATWSSPRRRRLWTASSSRRWRRRATAVVMTPHGIACRAAHSSFPHPHR